MKLETLKDLYIEALKDLYDAENQLLKALPLMARAASSEILRNILEEHRRITAGQVERLEEIFARLGLRARRGNCQVMRGIIEEGRQLAAETSDEDVLDASLIIAAQRIEHFEIAGYASVRSFAELLGHEDEAELLLQTLDEETETNQQLHGLARETIHLPAEKLTARR
jgi:ferritin-like metal-binding protein YciE